MQYLKEPVAGAEWVAADGLVVELVREEPFRVLEESENGYVYEIGTLNRDEWREFMQGELTQRAKKGGGKVDLRRVTKMTEAEEKLYEQVRAELRLRAGLKPQAMSKADALPAREIGLKKKVEITSPTPPIPASKSRILAQEILPLKDHTGYYLRLDKDVRFLPIRLKSPPGLMLDILDDHVYMSAPEELEVAGALISRVDILYYKGESPDLDGARRVDAIKLSFRKEADYSIETADGKVSVNVFPARVREAKAAKPSAEKPSALPAPPRAAGEVGGREQDEAGRLPKKVEVIPAPPPPVAVKPPGEALRVEGPKPLEARPGRADVMVKAARDAVKEYDYPVAQLKVEEALKVEPGHAQAQELKDQLMRRRELYDIVKQEVELHIEGLQKGFEKARVEREAQDQETDLKEAKEMIRELSLEAVADLVAEEDARILSLDEAVQVGLSHYGGLRAQAKERAAAAARVLESKRALLPNATLKFSDTDGKTLGVDFNERAYGLQIEQPLYTSGVLMNTLRQARLNHRLANSRYAKLSEDYSFRIIEAYYDLMEAEMSAHIQRGLMAEGGKALNEARARYEKELSRKLELLNVETQVNQIGFQVASAERDLKLAEFKLSQLLGGEEEEAFYGIPSMELPEKLEFTPLNLNLDEVLARAEENHPDLKMARLRMAVGQFEKKIAKGKEGFRVDLTGFLGQAGSNFATEDLDLNTERNFGIRVSRAWGGSTLSSSYTNDESARRLGETDRTEARVSSAELGLFDALKARGDVLEAKAEEERASEDFRESFLNVMVEAREAFYGYQEAILQVRNAIEKVKFQEEAVKVTQAEAGLNTSLTSDVLQAKIKLADERSLYVQALANYNVSIAKVNKAVGVAGHYKVGES
ncbi:MAG: TolC family protein [Candidatus Omnitrophica bacterium]|nr:TolC family protein [Candidatus Omnitrophota bacterium]